MSVEKILNAVCLSEMISEIENFCRESYFFEDDEICIRLKNQVAKKEKSDIHSLLSAYLCVCDCKGEVIDALYDFMANCFGFEEVTSGDTVQVTKKEFERILEECEGKCMIKSCIENENTIIAAETGMINKCREFSMRIRNNYICEFLPKINKEIEPKIFIAEELGAMLYDVLKKKMGNEYLRCEMKRYIPDIITDERDTRTLFRKYFCEVVLYQERKPGIYTKIDNHFKRAFIMEYFKRMIQQYIRK